MGVVAEVHPAELSFKVRGMTCTACAQRIESALAAVSGVAEARVDLASGTAMVRATAAAQPEVAELEAAVAKAGYELGALSETAAMPSSFGAARRAGAIGLAGAAGLLGFYLGVVTWAQGWNHALELLRQDAWFVGPIVAGFGTQVGLLAYLRALCSSKAKAGMAAGTGTSTAAMLACCAHHITEVAPILGLSAAAVFLESIKTPLLGVGLVMNAVGIAYMVRLLRRHRRMHKMGGCHGPSPA